MAYGYDEYPPEYDVWPPCDICGEDDGSCTCPECPTCGSVGDPKCYPDHMPFRPNMVGAFVHHIGCGATLRENLYYIDKYNPTHVWVWVRGAVKPIYYNTKPFPEPKPNETIVRIGLGGIAWDGTDWDFAEEVDVPADVAWGDLIGMLEQHFEDALCEHRGMKWEEDLNDLMAERAEAESKGLTDRVAEIDEEIRDLMEEMGEGE